MKPFRIVSTLILPALLLLALTAQAADKETAIFNFNAGQGGSDPAGHYPHGTLIADQAGNLYGSTQSGALSNQGAVFQLAPNGSGGWNLNVIYTCASTQDCSDSAGTLSMDSSGNLYGTTIFGGVFELSPDGSGGWTASTLYKFTGGVNGYDGFAPLAGLVVDAAGNVFGANFDGGINNQGYVFELSPGAGGFTLTHLHDFNGPDGSAPAAGLISDASGNLYGTTSLGGTSTLCTSGCGVVFEMSNNAGTWTETVLHSFNGNDGSNLQAPLLMDAAGNLYGTATSGTSQSKNGLVFKMSLVSGAWKARALYAFKGGSGDGAFPNTVLTMDAAGNLYGATGSGGTGDCGGGGSTGCGVAFELVVNGNRFRESVLHIFSGGGDGAGAQGLVPGAGGTVLGVATSGGGLFGGLIFQLSPGIQ
jgi:uncharacterized repeat protein (TIGR03803 family)